MPSAPAYGLRSSSALLLAVVAAYEDRECEYTFVNKVIVYTLLFVMVQGVEMQAGRRVLGNAMAGFGVV